MSRYVKGAIVGSILGMAASMAIINMYEPHTMRTMVRRGKMGIKRCANKIRQDMF